MSFLLNVILKLLIGILSTLHSVEVKVKVGCGEALRSLDDGSFDIFCSKNLYFLIKSQRNFNLSLSSKMLFSENMKHIKVIAFRLNEWNKGKKDWAEMAAAREKNFWHR